MLKILIISNLYPPNIYGGYEVGCADVAHALKSRGHEVDVLTSRSVHDKLVSFDKDVDRRLAFWDIFDAGHQGNAIRESTLFHAKIIDHFNLRVVAEKINANTYDVVYCFNLLGLGAFGICDFSMQTAFPGCGI